MNFGVDKFKKVHILLGRINKQGKAQAQRKAMIDLMNTKDHPEYAHPVYWAPFVVVGEGG